MRWPHRARRAVATLFRPYNDVDVYVEDTTVRNVYEVLLGRMLAGHARVNRVFQLGGRDQILADCAADQQPGGRSRIYIIDGDYDLLLGVPAPSLCRLYRLCVYSSENLLFSDLAALEVALESAINTNRNDIATRLDLPAFVASVAGALVPLFVVYAAAYELDPSIRSTGYSVMQLCTQIGNEPRLDVAKVSARAQAIEASLTAQFGATRVAATIAAIRARLLDRERSLRTFVSGKTYLLPLLLHLLKHRVSFVGTMGQLMVRLARYAELDVDKRLHAAIIACSKGHAGVH